MVSLELLAVTKSWPDMEVNVSLQAAAGKILSIAGPSGCGKSTVLRMASGLLEPDSGRVLVDGRDVTRLEPRARGIGMVFQDYALFPHLDVLGNVAYGLKHSGLSRAALTGRVERLLDTVGLAGFAKRRTQELSGGERQRVALARTLAVEPAIILFDEALSSLDAALRKRLRRELIDEQRRLGFTAVYVTHDLEEAMALGDHLAIMDRGRVLQCDTPRTLWESPGNVTVARFMGSGPCLPIERFESVDGCLLARTAAGSFSLPGLSSAPDVSGVCGTEQKPHVFFGRSDARRVTDGDNTNDVFVARCLRSDFIGDSVDCLMESGSGEFVLRFPGNDAPGIGESARYTVDPSRQRLLSGQSE